MESISFQIGGYHAPYSVEGRHPDGGGGVLCWAYSLAEAHRHAESFRLKGYRNVSVVKITPEMAGGLPIASENEVADDNRQQPRRLAHNPRREGYERDASYVGMTDADISRSRWVAGIDDEIHRESISEEVSRD